MRVRLEAIRSHVDSDPGFLDRVRVVTSPLNVESDDIPPAFAEIIPTLESLGETYCPMWNPIRTARFLLWGYGGFWWAQDLDGEFYCAPQAKRGPILTARPVSRARRCGALAVRLAVRLAAIVFGVALGVAVWWIVG